MGVSNRSQITAYLIERTHLSRVFDLFHDENRTVEAEPEPASDQQIDPMAQRPPRSFLGLENLIAPNSSPEYSLPSFSRIH